MHDLLSALRAVAEPTRLRLLALCAEAEMTVGELAEIVGQSQPRVSRHLKVLGDAGLLARIKEGNLVFHRLSAEDEGAAGRVARFVVAALPEGDAQLQADRRRLADAKHAHAQSAAKYFRDNAAQWDRLRSLHVNDGEVERALVELLPPGTFESLLDIGTGTGRVLELYGRQLRHGFGIDLSREMLAVARANLERAGLSSSQVRRADMYRLPVEDGRFDAAVFHQVLHYSDKPAAAIAEAARALKPGGRLAIVDFLPHDLEALRTEHAHRRLGFSDDEVGEWLRAARLEPGETRRLAGDPLTIGIWTALKPAALNPQARAPRRATSSSGENRRPAAG
jgi:ArsR family transcriptional regulator